MLTARPIGRGEIRSAHLASLEVTLVAHEVGPMGGMEHQLAELIAGLVGNGHRVTAVARRCALPLDVGIKWIRVPGPARPFLLAYLWFFVVGSWWVWRHRVGLVHTTGAIVWNRPASGSAWHTD
jgi:UDP-glucose:(heptosyl)LPS alpha-1,3-glucosyltransferase